jgi:hypothetical protein
MNQQAIAIVIAGALIAVAITLTNHWTLVAVGTEGGVPILRLNRWTGSVVRCGGTPQGEVWDVPCPLSP